MNTQSSLFAGISQTEIASLFLHSLGVGEIFSSKFLEGGLFNTTYHVVYGADRKQAVLRLGPVNRHLLMGFEENLMAAEVYICDVCAQSGIPCSHVLAVDTSKTIIDRDFMIVKYIPSIAMSNAALTELEKDNLYYKMGNILARLHKVTGECFGFVSRIQEGKHFDSWSKALFYEVEDILNRLKNRNAFSEEEIIAIGTLYQKNINVLDEIKTPHLLHTDLWEGNVLLDENTHEIAAIIDGDRAVFGDIDFEFASPWMQKPALLEEYGLKTEPAICNNRNKRIWLYRLFYALLETYVWFAEYNGEEEYKINRKKVFDLMELDRTFI